MDESPQAPGIRPASPIPIRLLLADAAGTAMLVAGVVLLVTDFSRNLPWDIDYRELGAGLLAGGVLLMLPMIWYIVQRAGNLSRRS